MENADATAVSVTAGEELVMPTSSASVEVSLSVPSVDSTAMTDEEDEPDMPDMMTDMVMMSTDAGVAFSLADVTFTMPLPVLETPATVQTIGELTY